MGDKGARAVILAVLMFFLAGVQQPEDVPAGPLLKATYEPGGTCDDCYAWRLSINTDGSFTLESKILPGWDTPDEWRTSSKGRLNQKQLNRLVDVIHESGFLTLLPRYSSDYELPGGAVVLVTDQDTVTIWVNVENQEHQVHVYGPEVVAGLSLPDRRHSDREAGGRFCTVWAQVLDSVKAPNRWQKAKYYR
ncbi:MAG: hypothetical protein ACRD88_21140 [Terriglobia bacterium]